MTEITLPQELVLDQYVTGLDANGNLTSSQVGYHQLSFEGVFGQKTFSNTQNTVGVGVKVWTLDTNDGNWAIDDPVQVKSTDDRACYMYGIITALDTTISPVQITVLCIRT